MATEVGVGYISIVPEVQGFASDLQKKTGSAAGASGKAAGKTFGAGLATVGATVAGLGIANVFSDAVTEAEDATQSTAKLSEVMNSMGFGQFTADVQDYASALADKIQIDNDDIAKTQAKIATFKNLAATAGDTEGYFNRLTKASYNLASLGFGSAEQHAVMLSKALNSPEQAAALTRTGALTKAEAAHAVELAKAGKAEEARAYMMAAIEKQLGESAEKSVTPTQRMGKTWDDVLETLGTVGLPLLEALANVISVIPVPVLAAGIGVLAVALGAALVAPLVTATAAVWAFTAALLANPITWVILAIVALVAAIVWMVANWDTVKNALSVAWDWIKEKFLAFVGGFTAAWSQTWESIKGVLATAWGGIKATISTAINAVQNVIRGALNTVGSIWDNTFGRMWEITKKVAAGIGAAIEKAKGIVIGAVDAIRRAIAAVKDAIAGVPLIGGFASGLIPSFAAGGEIPGSGAVPMIGHGGEFMLNRQMVAQFGGVAGLEAMRQGGPIPGGGGGIHVENLNVINPQAEPTSESLPSAVRKLAYVGVG